MFPDAFWLEAGIAQALPAFLRLRGLFCKGVKQKRGAGQLTPHNHFVHDPAIYYRAMKIPACFVLIMVRDDPGWCSFFILPHAITK
ncbi:hypothetical protein [Achromobacter sp.]|uniref:hypothetical protein n=1 Tax=Achromobacter sp. TaxID=134375 RepID=UPI00289DE812|nr:hypothetical protein [Achromobacter sp.]